MSKPTLIFAAGAWYPPTIFDPIIKELGDYTCHSIVFPSIQQASSVVELGPDIEAVRSITQQEADTGHDIVIIAHSWAGLPVSSALDGLSKSERVAAHQKGGVVKLIFIAAFLPNIGEGLIGAFGGRPPPWYVRDDEKGTVSASDALVLFFHDVANGAEWVKLLKPHSWATQNAPATGAAYVNIPSAYLLTENDRATPLPVQQVLVERARRKGAQIETEKIQTGHTPWLAMPGQVVNYIKNHARESVEGTSSSLQ
ncbi:Cyclic AMP-dependent chloride channel [Penicillium digitatum]|uniref:AB hydrolase-1 domain-containing protein n=3 Tax=Penicillium digitatum TaxID=36651 RepID=K9G2V5_PEND2|nr:hypothetical protein PDIP_72780 [Penicillium digitatum Pd1]EKV07654.1 hypothetical protein PDIP_72780 [Penicillium digitatum Pd1]EKV09208.1 hypothetical protein PDIG_63410 [Penicillium digitatum PHI26]KAG0159205.1 hypothetical protein PDIDSM_6726 [Penicillium digitatum]QQK41310.1 Cyclic AMP-dependent chloride channel [Penicillium digitatum]